MCRHLSTATGSECSPALLMSVTRPRSTNTSTPEPIVNPCSSSQRPDMRRYGTTASGRFRRTTRRADSVSAYGGLAARAGGSLRGTTGRSTSFRTRRRRGRLRVGIRRTASDRREVGSAGGRISVASRPSALFDRRQRPLLQCVSREVHVARSSSHCTFRPPRSHRSGSPRSSHPRPPEEARRLGDS